jgi:GxxExxY protein
MDADQIQASLFASCESFRWPADSAEANLNPMSKLIYPEESYRIRGACFELYKLQGCGFTEAIYQECLEAELEFLGIPFDAQRQFPLLYKGRRLRHTFIPDLVCFGKILLELKAASDLTDEHRAQLLNYLQASGMHLGFLINFGHYPKIQIERFVNLDGYCGLA